MADELIELGISRALRSSREDLGLPLLRLVDRLLVFIPEALLRPDAAKGQELRELVEKLRNQIMAAGDRATIEEAGRSLLALFENQVKQSRGQLSEREKAYTDLIQLLRNAIAEVAGESDSFHNQLMGSSERIGRLTEVPDIHTLRQQIAREVQTLKNAVVEKKKHDQIRQEKLSKEIDNLRFRLERAKEEAALDPLTQVANRRSFDRAIQHWIQAQESGAGDGFVLAMLDVDDFKQINDVHGHLIGDRVLLCVAQMVGRCVRDSDYLARYGGEEFVLLLRGANLPQAEARLIATLKAVADSTFEYENRTQPTPVKFTLSCGLAEYSPGDSGADLIRRADEGLYDAKRRGKNQVRVKRKSLLSSMLDRRKKTQE
jgi:diguanylate cyclase